jgi:dipeptidyl-peptidase 4
MSDTMMSRPFALFLLAATLLGSCAAVEPVVNDEPAVAPEMMSAGEYERAAGFLSWNLSAKIYRSAVHPFWLENNDFWYRVDIPEGQKFYYVDSRQAEKRPAFDHERLSLAIEEQAGMDIPTYRLPFRFFEYAENQTEVQFRFNGKLWRCDIEIYECAEPEELPRMVPNSVDSPDGRYAAFIKDHNLWVYDRETGEEIQLTDDGKKHYGYAVNSQGWTRGDNPILLWSPDSRRIATFQQDERKVEKMPLIRTGTGRPGFDLWPYALPGDENVPMLERVVIDVRENQVTRLDVEASHQRTSNCCGLTRGENWADVEWSDDGEHLAFVSTSRDYNTVTLYVANPESGEVREIYSETDEPFFESNLTSRGIPNWTVLHESNEFIWYTRSDNWGHLYLHDLGTGELKNRITSGDWNVIDILRIDEQERSLMFTAVGREEGRDPYFRHLYRVNFDGSGLSLLTGENGNHQVSVSPDGNYFTTTRSQPQTVPVSQLKKSDGSEVLELEEADISELEEIGFRPPRPFSVKARDGVTDIYGLLIKPSDFDPEKSYPIVNSIYPGPQVGSVGTRSFSTNRRGQAHALAELGFIVVLVDGLGTPYRTKDFHTHWFGDMADNGLEDQVAAMEQLAGRYEWINLDRAGIYGHSGGGYATAAAMFRFPGFFKAGVSSAGNHDNRGYTYYWGEKYQGLLERSGNEDTYSNQAIHRKAENLEGKLLISYGTMDSNVHPNLTLQVIDQLIHHNKDFDLMVFPNRGHGYSNESYNIRITWDYFVRHLLGKEPPAPMDLR